MVFPFIAFKVEYFIFFFRADYLDAFVISRRLKRALSSSFTLNILT